MWVAPSFNKSLKAILYYMITGLILVIPAIMNNAPLVYSDTGSYLNASRTLLPMIDRSVGYAFIIRAVTWQSTLWTVVFFQGMVASWMIHRTMRTLFPAMGNAWRPHVIVLVVLLALSSLPWYASQLMPDALSGYIALGIFLLLFGRGLSTTEVVLLWAFLFFFTIAHLSHLVITLILAATIWLFKLIGSGRPWRPTWWTVAGVAVTPLLGILFLVGYNARHGQGFVLSPTSSLFISGKLIESGTMRIYLDRTCHTNPHRLCANRDDLSRTGMYYVWEENAPTRNGVSMTDASRALDPLVRDILSSPHMWPVLMWTSALATLEQFLQVDIGSGLHDYGEGSAPYSLISQHWQHELPGYMNSTQQRNAWWFVLLNPLNMWVMLASCCFLVVRWPVAGPLRWRAFILLLVVCVFANAAATGALANIYGRLQARVTWLLLFGALLLALQRSSKLRRAFLFPLRGTVR